MVKIANFDPGLGDLAAGSTAIIAGSAAAAAVGVHAADTTDAHQATGVAVLDQGSVRHHPLLTLSSGASNAGRLAATNVEAALAEISGALGMSDAPVRHYPLLTLSSGLGVGRIPHLTGPAAHAASNITIVDAAGHFISTNVEGALDEIAVGISDHGALTGLADDDHSAYALAYGGGEELVSAHGNMGATETFAPASGNWHTGTFNAACTFTFTGPTNATGCSLFLELTQDGTGGWAMTLPASFANKAALEAAQVTTASTTAFLLVWTRDGGTTWYGAWVGGSALTVKDEGVALATAASTLDFVGAGVTAAGTGTTKTVTIPGGATSPLTTKGDLWGFDTGNARVPVGTNGYPLIADSTDAQGVTYGPITVVAAYPFHAEPLTDGASNFIFAGGDIVVVTGVPN